VAAAPIQQQVDGFPRCRASINVVSQEHVEGTGRSGEFEVVVNGREDSAQFVDASVNVADGVNANSFWQSGLVYFLGSGF
jgi:hypothetical protein